MNDNFSSHEKPGQKSRLSDGNVAQFGCLEVPEDDLIKVLSHFGLGRGLRQLFELSEKVEKTLGPELGDATVPFRFSLLTRPGASKVN